MNGKTYIVIVTVLYGSLLSAQGSNTEINYTGSPTTMEMEGLSSAPMDNDTPLNTTKMVGPSSAPVDKDTPLSLHGERIFDINFETNESSTREGYPPASPAFDDNIGPEPGGAVQDEVCSHTDEEYDPWWYVDIRDLYTIDHVVLHNRMMNSGFLEGAQVRIGNSTNNLKQNTACGPPVSKVEASVHAGNITLRCEPGTVGNIVSVQLEGKRQYLTLCEVKIYGTIFTEYLTTLVMEEIGPTVTSPSYDPTTMAAMERKTDIYTPRNDPTTMATMERKTDIYTPRNDPTTMATMERKTDIYTPRTTTLDEKLEEGESREITNNYSRGFEARLYKNGTLHERKLTNETDSVSVALQVASNQDPYIVTALIGKPKRFDDLTVKNGLDNRPTTQVEVGTDILEIYIYDSDLIEIVAGINIEFKYPNSQFNLPKEQAICAFFNETLSYWSTKGCVTKAYENHVKCTCNHTTSYAILFQTSESETSKTDKIVMDVITYIGLIISTVFLLAALVTQNVLPELRKSTRFKILTHLIIGAILSNIVFLTLELAQDHEILCYIYTGILHYSLLVVFVWMMIFSADLYAKVFYSFANHHKRMQWSKFVGWALPFCVVLITVAVTQTQYTNLNVCWLNTNNGTVWAFIGPAILVVLINIALISRVLIEVSKKSRSANVTEKRKLDDLKYVAVRASLLLPVIGVTWVFGIMVLFDDHVVFMYMFVITNTFQGALIWMTQFFWSREVKNAWTSMKKKKQYSLKTANSRKKKDSSKEFNGIDECAISPPNSTIDNTYSMTSKKSLTVSSDLTLTTYTTKN